MAESRAVSSPRQITIVFDRIGRNYEVEPLTLADTATAKQIAAAVQAHARPHLGSRRIDVRVDPETGKVWIAAGFGHAGSGLITR